MLDAMPDGEPVQWLYGPMREYPSRPGKALAASTVPVRQPGVRGRADDAARASRWQSSCCTTHFLSTMTSPTAARCAVADRHLPRRTAWRPRSTLATDWRSLPDRCCGGRHGGSTAISPTWCGTNSTPWPAHAGGTGHRGRLAARQCRGPAARRLPRADHAQDMLVHHDPSAPRRRDWSVRAVRPTWRRWCASAFISARPSRSATTCSIWSATNVPTARRSSATSTRASARCRSMHLLASATGADRALVRDYLRRNRAERSAELVGTVRALMDEYGSIAFTSRVRRRHPAGRRGVLRAGIRRRPSRAGP